VELTSESNEEDQYSVFEAVIRFLENNSNSNMRDQVIESLSGLFAKTNMVFKTALPRKLLEIARKVSVIGVMCRKLSQMIGRGD
jgi:hypothetical protein